MLEEVGALLTLNTVGTCTKTRVMSNQKWTLIERKIDDLETMHQLLEALVQQCDTGQNSTTCPIIDVLAKD